MVRDHRTMRPGLGNHSAPFVVVPIPTCISVVSRAILPVASTTGAVPKGIVSDVTNVPKEAVRFVIKALVELAMDAKNVVEVAFCIVVEAFNVVEESVAFVPKIAAPVPTSSVRMAASSAEVSMEVVPKSSSHIEVRQRVPGASG